MDLNKFKEEIIDVSSNIFENKKMGKLSINRNSIMHNNDNFIMEAYSIPVYCNNKYKNCDCIEILINNKVGVKMKKMGKVINHISFMESELSKLNSDKLDDLFNFIKSRKEK